MDGVAVGEWQVRYYGSTTRIQGPKKKSTKTNEVYAQTMMMPNAQTVDARLLDIYFGPLGHVKRGCCGAGGRQPR